MLQSDLFCSLAKLHLTSAGNFPRVTGINNAPYDSGVIPIEESSDVHMTLNGIVKGSEISQSVSWCR